MQLNKKNNWNFNNIMDPSQIFLRTSKGPLDFEPLCIYGWDVKK